MGFAVSIEPHEGEGSCDTCSSQEGRHYCLLHGMIVKNMDIVKCCDWKERRDG
jgi:hypothetical protein